MRHLADKVHTEGYDLDLPCKAIGAWPITYNWFINGHNFKRRFRVNVKNEGTLLRIQRIRARDAGVYTCLASNKYGNLSFSFPLKIKGSLICFILRDCYRLWQLENNKGHLMANFSSFLLRIPF